MRRGENFFDMIPVKSQKIEWEIKDDNTVQLIINRDSIFDKIVRKFFNTPEKMYIDLDDIGSYVWKSIDGERNVYEISKLLKDRFGEKAEPLNDRLITYISILRNNKFIKLVKAGEL
ncbi:PqqD family protein [Caldisalinibacter kiritimatiensis]|uniref:Coenzyme PQQ synthesis protein D (PqqD) n=1 Tax=Caldisalinibacter kiritimatiensis TaxID=1304284 RepID=R1CTL8_9FIRM|nr:PqqD family protein [Caldisalinibacter kiritimatiensis]EOD00019.1 hypothetical protein L21TH_1908 [Caldisalinibacter kiritimatiensis]